THTGSHEIDTAVGVDGFSHEDCMAIPNEKLLEFLFYPLITLECCMLKMLTFIIERRIREGAADIGAIPPTQNGFQDGLRTNYNVFVLLFPGTDRSALWVKLATMGISGPMIE
ncbi:hypothetical protein B0H19DRAFT_886131, partial [Mycena capillaripes]